MNGKRNTLSSGKAFTILLLLLLVPMLASAMGNSEKPYNAALDEEFASIAAALEAGDIDMETALAQLHEFRTGYARTENEDYRTMEMLLTAVREQTMTAERARERLHQLDEYTAPEDALQLQTRTMTQTQTQTSREDAEPERAGGSSADSGSSGGQVSGGSSGGASGGSPGNGKKN